MNENLKIYNAVREVPRDAQKPIQGGRLRGKTEIRPMWRIEKLTELFGPAGFGWYTEIVRQWFESTSTGEVAVFCLLNLYVKIDGEWSKPIEGLGGNKFIEKEKNGLYVEDEAVKMAYTDALGVAGKSLGFGSDIYWGGERSKYHEPTTPDYSQEAMEREPQKEIRRRVEEPAPADNNLDLAIALNDMQSAPTLAECKRIWSQWPMFQTNAEFIKAKNDRKKYFETH